MVDHEDQGGAPPARSHRCALSVLGVTVSVDCSSPSVCEDLSSAWSRCLADDSAPAGKHVIGIEEFESLSLLDHGHSLATRITAEAIDATAARRLIFHASGVADGHGRVVALVGSSGAGKTTAAQVLSRQSFGYVTDEAVSVGDVGDVIAFPRPLAASSPGDVAGPKIPISPDQLGLKHCVDDLELTRIVLLDRRDGVTTPSLARVPLLDGILELIPQISALARRANPLQRLCRLIDRCDGVFRLIYGEAEQLDRVLHELLDTPPEAPGGWARMPDPSSWAWRLMDGRVRRAPRRDCVFVEDDDEALFLIDRTPARVSGIGLTVWFEAGDAPTIAELVDRVVAQHGPHPQAEQLVRDAVTQMCEAEVLGYGRPVTVEEFRATEPPTGPSWDWIAGESGGFGIPTSSPSP